MNVAEWILVIMLSCALFIFLVVGILLLVKLIHLANEAGKIVATGQGIAAKADDIVDNVKGMTSVGGIVKTFANRVVENQERRYAAEDAERKAEEKNATEAAKAAEEAIRNAAAEQAAETAYEEAVVREAIRRTEAGRAAATNRASASTSTASRATSIKGASRTNGSKSSARTSARRTTLKSKLSSRKNKQK